MYSKLYNNVFEPLYENYIKKRKMMEIKEFLEKSQWWSRDRLLEFQWGELKKLLKHAYNEVPYWQKIFKDMDMHWQDISNFKDFQKLPVITKEDIRQNRELMVAKNYIGRTLTKATGGSSGVPLEFEYTSESYSWRTAISKRGYSWAKCKDGNKQAYIWGTAIGEVPLGKRIKENLHHWILRQKYFNCFKFNEEEMGNVLLKLNAYKPEIIVGYTNPLYNFAKFINDNNNKVGFKPKAVVSAAEKLHEFQRKEIENVFECPVFNTYGSREFMLIASECDVNNGLHLSMENLLVEVVGENGIQKESGEMGDVVITDFHNYGMPFIRYKNDDIAIFSDKKCTCGRGLIMLDDIVGRSLDMIKTPDGLFVPGEFFPHLMKEFEEIKRFQVLQEKIDKITIKIIKRKDISEERMGFLKKEICKVIGKEIVMDFQFVREIPLTRTGKNMVVISKVK